MCETVKPGLLLKNGDMMRIQALVVPIICNPLTSQPISHTKETYDYLVDLELADSANAEDCLEVDALTGSDLYWSLVTGEVRQGNYGPMAIYMKLGWVLSGPTSGLATSVNLSTYTTTHILITTGTVCTTGLEQALDEQLKKFWGLETLGIVNGEWCMRNVSNIFALVESGTVLPYLGRTAVINYQTTYSSVISTLMAS